MPFGQLSAVGVEVWVDVGVAEGAGVAVIVAVDVPVDVEVGEGVTVGPSSPPGPQAEHSTRITTAASPSLRFIIWPPHAELVHRRAT